jgi:hypothetical protein
MRRGAARAAEGDDRCAMSSPRLSRMRVRAPVNSTSLLRYQSNGRADVIGGVEAITTSTARWQPSPHLPQAGHSASGDEFSRPGRY